MAKAFGGLGTTAGLAADRTSMTGMSAGQQFFETDTNTLYIYNGTAWIKIPSADDEAYAYLYHNSVVAFPSGNTKIPWSVITNNKNISLSTGSITFAKTGIYEFNLGFRLGTGSDVWTGVNLISNATGSIVAYGYGIGQVGGNDPGGASWQFLANITSALSYDVRVWRGPSTMTNSVPDANAGWAYTLSISRLSS